MPSTIDRRGLAVIAGTFVLWGVVPLYWRLLEAVPSLQIIAHRLVWSAVLVIGWLLWKQGRGWLRAALARPRVPWMLALSALLIGVNWGLYIWAVNAGHVVEASLGYFITPLVNVMLGVLLLRERLKRVQWASVVIAALGVLWLTLGYGHPPWVALGLAFSFGLYGLIRKLVSVEAIPGLGIENVYLLLPALVLIAWGESNGTSGFVDGWGLWLDALLIVGGVITALPLIGFAYGVRRIPLSVVGLLQYIAPTLQLIIGVAVFGEVFGPERAIGFGAIWVALAIYAADGLWRARRRPATVPVKPAEAARPCAELR